METIESTIKTMCVQYDIFGRHRHDCVHTTEKCNELLETLSKAEHVINAIERKISILQQHGIHVKIGGVCAEDDIVIRVRDARFFEPITIEIYLGYTMTSAVMSEMIRETYIEATTEEKERFLSKRDDKGEPLEYTRAINKAIQKWRKRIMDRADVLKTEVKYDMPEEGR